MAYEGYFKGLQKGGRLFRNGDIIPILGFGTGTEYFDRPDAVAEGIILSYEAGYRLIDTAQAYGTEKGVGAAVVKLIENGVESNGMKVTRQDMFLESKVVSRLLLLGNQKNIRDSIEESLKLMCVKTLDLMLLHTPGVRTSSEKWLKGIAEKDRERIPKTSEEFHQARIEAWEVLQQAKEDGLVCHIGVSNWNDEHLSKLLNDPRCKVVPELNQIENHPYHVGQNVIDFCNKHQILIQAYGPLGNGRSERAKGGPDGDLKRVLDDPDINDISKIYNLTVAQVCLKWAIQKGILPVIKSENEGRLKENMAALEGLQEIQEDGGVRLTDEDMERIDKLNKQQNIFMGWYNML